MSKIKVAIIGCGTIANSAHIPAYMANPDAEIKYFLRYKFPERAKAAVEKYNAVLRSPTTRRFLLTPEVEAVSVCTPNKSTPLSPSTA
jgi:predicted dehydrogenase